MEVEHGGKVYVAPDVVIRDGVGRKVGFVIIEEEIEMLPSPEWHGAWREPRTPPSRGHETPLR